MKKEVKIMVKKQFTTSLFGTGKPTWSKPYSMLEFIQQYPDEAKRENLIRSPGQVRGVQSGKSISYDDLLKTYQEQKSIIR